MQKAHWDFGVTYLADDVKARFCTSCGDQKIWCSPEVRGDKKSFSPTTGEEISIDICLNRVCQTGYGHKHKMKSDGFFSVSETCEICHYNFTDV